MSEQQTDAYLAGMRSTLKEQWRAFYDKLALDRTSAEWDALAAASRQLRAETARLTGVECPACSGHGQIAEDLIPASLFAPEEVVSDYCKTCDGVGKVMPKERAKWIELHPDYEEDD